MVRSSLAKQLEPANSLARPTPAKAGLISHQGSYCRAPAGIALVERLKHAVVRCTTSVAISKAVAARFNTESTVIPNPYDARRFSLDSSRKERPGDLDFLGRLVSEKGIDVLLKALAKLRTHGLSPRTHNRRCRSGVYRHEANGRSSTSSNNQVIFAGLKRDEELLILLRKHKVLVVPSMYDEPFGVVALEGIACGCVVVGSAGGASPEAIGPCGITVPNGDAGALAQALEQLLLILTNGSSLLCRAPQHRMISAHDDRQGVSHLVSLEAVVILLSHPTANQN